jgi:hypothetical protein
MEQSNITVEPIKVENLRDRINNRMNELDDNTNINIFAMIIAGVVTGGSVYALIKTHAIIYAIVGVSSATVTLNSFGNILENKSEYNYLEEQLKKTP